MVFFIPFFGPESQEVQGVWEDQLLDSRAPADGNPCRPGVVDRGVPSVTKLVSAVAFSLAPPAALPTPS